MQLNTLLGRKQRFLSNCFALLISASLVLTSFAAIPASRAMQTGETPEVTTPDPARVDIHQIVYKLKASNQAGALSAQPAVQGLDAQPLFTTPLAALKAKAPSVSAQAVSSLPRLDLYYRARLSPNTAPADAQKVLDSLKANPAVELAYFEPIYLPAAPLMIETDYTDQQIYLEAADQLGIDARYAWTLTGGRGANVQLIDIEGGWQIGHEDLPIKNSSLIESANGSDRAWVDHGTAVLGIIAAEPGDPNSDTNFPIGVTGIASDTYIRMVSTISYPIADAIIKAAANLTAGDIIVLPIQAKGPQSGLEADPACTFEAIPVEYTQAVFDAIYTVTQLGIIVVESAGDGAMNLDDARYNNLFKRSTRDSGAIIVGAGDSTSLEPIACSNYGKRIDMQGWGNNVVTTGYGDLDQGTDADGNPDPNQAYTATFGGTSAAAAMVAGAASSLQGVAKARGYTLTPDLVRSILRSTGTAQGGDTTAADAHLIGPLPNLKDAIDKKLSSGVQRVSPGNGARDLNTLRPTFAWQAFLGATQYELLVSDRPTMTTTVLHQLQTGTEYTPDSGKLVNGTMYYWKVRALVLDEKLGTYVWQAWPNDPWSFSLKAITAPAITLYKPDNGSVSSNYAEQTFRWYKPSKNYAGGYQFQISTNFDFSGSDLEDVDDETRAGGYTPATGLEPNTRYYWHVRSVVDDGQGNISVGPWSGRRTLYTGADAGELTTSVLEPTSESLRPTVDWPDVENARGYEVSFSIYQDCSKPFRSVTISVPSNTTTPSKYSQYTLTSDLPRNKEICWRVRVRGLYGYSVWVQADPIAPRNPPYAPVPTSPANYAVMGKWQQGITLKWRPSTTTKPAPDGGYEVQIATRRDFIDSSIIASPTTAADVLFVDSAGPFEPETTYFWHVRARGADGTSNWSGIRTFYTTPAVPTGLAVDDTERTLRPVLNWNKVDIARSYQVQVSRDQNFSSTKILATVTTKLNPPYALGATLPRNATIYWRVRSGGLHGYSAWSEVGTIETPNPPVTPVLASPSSAANLTSFTPTLDWYNSAKIDKNPDSNATSYELEISSSSTFDPTKQVLDVPGLTASKYLVKDIDLVKAGTYYWRVRAVNDAGEFSLWSSSRSFTTPAQIKGTIVDAMNTATNLSNVSVEVQGRALQVISAADGTYTVRGLLPGDYTLTSTLPGYLPQRVSFSVGYGTNLTRNIQLVQLPNDNQIRIVLYWNGTPANMDAHLWLPSTHKAHISKDDPHTGGAADPNVRAELTVQNDTNGFGPEVITLGGYFTGQYTFAVYQSGSAENFINTKAIVYVYKGRTPILNSKGGDPIRSIPITTSSDQVGHWWRVFTLDVKSLVGGDPTQLDNYSVNIQNQIYDQEPVPAGY